jgi:hypothetical protein
MTETANTLWYNVPFNLHLLAQFIKDEGGDIDEVIEMLDKPWHFDAEFGRAYARLMGRLAASEDLTESRTL